MKASTIGAALIGCACAIAVGCYVQESPPPAPRPWQQTQPIERDTDCDHIPLDGDRGNLQRRLECEGIDVVGPCELSEADRAAFERMGVEVEQC